MVKNSLSVREVINEFVVLGSQHGGFLAMVTAAVATGYILIDLFTNGAGSSIASLVVSIFVQFLVVERLLADRLPEGKARIRRYGAVFSSAFLGGLGMVVGLIVFIIPGLILMAAWSASTPFIVVEEMSGPKALGASWEATEGSRTALTLVVAIGFVATVFTLVLLYAALYLLSDGFALDEASDQLSLAEIIPSNIVVSAVGVLGWLFGAAVYRLLKPVDGPLGEVFA